MFNFLFDNIVAAVIVMLVIVALALWYFYQRDFSALAQAQKHAHRPLSEQALRTATEEADLCGLGREFRAYIQGINLRLGANQLKVGHLLWIFDQLEQNIRYDATLTIPEFSQALR
ncbi:hypothetical protein LMJ53_14000 [Rheinheimera sp. UJ51]|uniref:hypothetical protein n=1 Tax=Rheinheimera sp. UJ51 TaxID=2892446 RepID=UPI001E5EA9D7|nr:hypothetical protein [Rheinheimera sp. UJ51]MCC5452836.1 hypothetical protein [Rheinheimera sp. UJ51]